MASPVLPPVPPVPTPEQVRRLPRSLGLVVPPEASDDVTEHVGVAHLLGLHARGKVLAFAALGLDPARLPASRRNVFDLEHHLRYLDEVLAGDSVAVHVRLIGHSAKVVHGISFLLDETRDSLAGTCEFTCVHVDLDTRRTTPMDGPLLAAVEARVSTDSALDWPAPVCGSLAIR